jgi:hypothetical protein
VGDVRRAGRAIVWRVSIASALRCSFESKEGDQVGRYPTALISQAPRPSADDPNPKAR